MSANPLMAAADRARDPHMAKILRHKATHLALDPADLDLPSSPPHSWGGGPASSPVEGSPISNHSLLPILIGLGILALILWLTPPQLWAF